MRQRLPIVAIAIAAPLAPLTASAQATIESVVTDIDTYRAQAFADAGLTYQSPPLQSVDGPMTPGCGSIDPYFSPGAYCAADQTDYYSTAWAPNESGSEILWWTVLSNEWGHHIQWQVDTGIATVLESELQADCFAGAYMRHAEDAGLVSPAPVTVALGLTQSAGDVWFLLPHDAPDHGAKAERVLAFMNGMIGDFANRGFVG